MFDVFSHVQEIYHEAQNILLGNKTSVHDQCLAPWSTSEMGAQEVIFSTEASTVLSMLEFVLSVRKHDFLLCPLAADVQHGFFKVFFSKRPSLPQ